MKETLNPNEWIMMEALWAESPATLGETIACIGDKVNWSYKTYQSYMNILEKKGFVTAVKRGRAKFYSPSHDELNDELRSKSVQNSSIHTFSKTEKVPNYGTFPMVAAM